MMWNIPSCTYFPEYPASHLPDKTALTGNTAGILPALPQWKNKKPAPHKDVHKHRRGKNTHFVSHGNPDASPFFTVRFLCAGCHKAYSHHNRHYHTFFTHIRLRSASSWYELLEAVFFAIDKRLFLYSTNGLISSPLMLTANSRLGPVAVPVCPIVAMTCPFFISSPSDTFISFR